MKNYFLQLIKDARFNRQSLEKEVDYALLYQLSNEHQVSPLIYNQIYRFTLPADLKMYWKNDAIKANAFQAMKTDKFLRLYQQFLDANLKVIVVKGIVCRNLYPVPDNRPSNDEDLYVQVSQFDKACEIMKNNYMQLIEESEDVSTFLDPTTGLSIELHTQLFSTSSKAYGSYQKEFDHAFDDVCIHTIQGIDIYSLNHTLHFLFLLMHFIKHFLHGGVGIRQLVDVITYGECFKEEINWNEIEKILKNQNVYDFTQAVFALGYQYFDFNIEGIDIIDKNALNGAYDDILDDIIDAGIFGKSSLARLHSSTMTLNVFNTGKPQLLKSLFPTLKEMKAKCEYLNEYPILLPVAYVSRILSYLKKNDSSSRAQTIEIGNHRIDMLKKYKMIK